MSYDVVKLTRELVAAGLPVTGCAADGKLTLEEGAALTAEQQATADAVFAAHDPARPTDGQLHDRSGGLAGACAAVLAQLLDGTPAPEWALAAVRAAAQKARP